MALISVSASADDLHPPFHPVRVEVVELATALPTLTGGFTRDGVPYGSVRTLVTLHDEPLGLLDHDLAAGDIGGAALAHGIYAELGGAIDEHLRDDGLDGTWSLESTGLVTSAPVRCRADDDDATTSVTVVLSTTGGRLGLERTLDSLLASDYRSFEVLVVDHGAPGNITPAVVAKRREVDGRVRYLAVHDENRSNARNAAFGLSRGDLVAFTDEGCEAAPGWLNAVATTFQSHPSVACVVGPVLTPELETPPQLAFEAATAVTGGWRRRVMDRSGSVSGPGEPPFLTTLFGSGDNIAVQKRLLGDLWGFDPHLGPRSPAGAADDLDVVVGFLADGHQVAFEPRALVWRRHPADVATVRALLRDRTVGLGAMLTKQMVAGALPRSEVLRRMVSMSATNEPPSPGSRLAQITTGLWAYLRSRLKRSWATA